MAGLTFSNQGQGGRSGGSGSGFWWVSLILIVISAALITLYVRFDGGSAFAAARSGVQSVTKPIEQACSVLSTPFDALSDIGKDEEIEQLEMENEQLRTLVAQLEEYRQQDRRLTSLVEMADMYDLETISAEVTGTTTGWDRTATINKGSDDGIQVGQGVISSCGLYGQIESVTNTTATVRLVNDADASTSAMLQSSHERGIVQGAYDGTLTLEYISIDSTVGEGDIVITSGQGGTYPRGIVVGTVTTIETDSSRLYYRLTVEPIYSISDCEEVMVLTGDEDSTANLLDEETIEAIINASSSVSSSDTTADGDGGSSEDAVADKDGSEDAGDGNEEDADTTEVSSSASSGRRKRGSAL